MSHNSEISKAERRQLAVASATLGPWRAAAAVGALGGGVALALGTFGDGIGLGVLAGALSVALMLFFMVGGAGAVLGHRTGADSGPDRRVRRWAAAHPWRVAAVPGTLMVIADVSVSWGWSGASPAGRPEDQRETAGLRLTRALWSQIREVEMTELVRVGDRVDLGDPPVVHREGEHGGLPARRIDEDQTRGTIHVPYQHLHLRRVVAQQPAGDTGARADIDHARP
jgi:hypothetical protein